MLVGYQKLNILMLVVCQKTEHVNVGSLLKKLTILMLVVCQKTKHINVGSLSKN